MALTALVLACTLRPSPAESSSVLLGQQVLDALAEHAVSGELVRVVDQTVRFGVSTDEGEGDEWPSIREKMLAADGVTYWVGEAMQTEDYQDQDPTPEKTAETTRTVAANAAHLAAQLQRANYPA